MPQKEIKQGAFVKIGRLEEKRFFSILVNIFFISLLFPYVSPLPTTFSDIQPIVGFIACLIIFFLFINRKLYFDNIEICFLVFAVISFVLFTDLSSGTEYLFKKRIGLFFAFLVFYVCKRYNHLFRYRILLFAVIIYFAASMFQLIDPPLFKYVSDYVIRDLKVADPRGLRGISPFTTEPGFLASLNFFFLLAVDYFKATYHIRRKYSALICTMAIFMMIASKSLTGVVLLLVYAGYKILRKFSIKKVALLSLVIVIFGLFSYQVPRQAVFVKKLFSSPVSVLQDASLSYRVSAVLSGFVVLSKYPFGASVGSKRYSEDDVERDLLNLYDGLNIPRKYYLREAPSVFRHYSTQFGFLFIIFLLIVCSPVFKNRNSGFLVIFFIVFSLCQSFPIVYPPLWFIIGVYCQKRSFRIKARDPAYLAKSESRTTGRNG